MNTRQSFYQKGELPKWYSNIKNHNRTCLSHKNNKYGIKEMPMKLKEKNPTTL